jgi:hypothetical protein
MMIYVVTGIVCSNEAINMDYYIFEFLFILWEKKAVGLIKNKLVKGLCGRPPLPPRRSLQPCCHQCCPGGYLILVRPTGFDS